MELDNSTTITPLVSERDRNFLISTNEEKAILKISNHKEERGVLELQTDALLHLQETTRMRRAQQGLEELRKHVDTIIVIPNQN